MRQNGYKKYIFIQYLLRTLSYDQMYNRIIKTDFDYST